MTKISMVKRDAILIFAVLFLIPILIGFVGAVDYTACQGLSAIPSGNHRVTGFVNNSLGGELTCFILGNSDIDFDCQGNYIWQDDNSTHNAFDILASTNVTIRNCNIMGFSKGISAGNNSNLILINNTFEKVGNAEIELINSSNSVIRNNILNSPSSSYGIYMDGCLYNLVSGNIINKSDYGFAVYSYDSNYTIITGNQIEFRANPPLVFLTAISITLSSYVQASFNKFTPQDADIYAFDITDSKNAWLFDNDAGINSSIIFNGLTNNLTLTNHTYTNTRSGATAIFRDEYHAEILVKDANGTFVENANILFFNSTGQLTNSVLTNSLGRNILNISDFTFDSLVFSYQYPYFVNVSKNGVENVTYVNLTGVNWNYTVYLDMIENVTPNATNQLPYINEPNANQYFSCVLRNQTLIVYINAVDPDNDPIFYSYQCSLTDAIHNFTTNNTFTCDYSTLGDYIIKMYANDSFHGDNYVGVNETVYVTKSSCVQASGGVKIPMDLVNKDNIDEGILPMIYYTTRNFISLSLPSFIYIGFAVLFVMILGGTVLLIGKIISGGR